MDYDLIALRLAAEWDIDPTPANLARLKKTYAYATLALGASVKELGWTLDDLITRWCVPPGVVTSALNRDQRDHT